MLNLLARKRKKNQVLASAEAGAGAIPAQALQDDVQAVLDAFKTTPAGLSSDQAARRLLEYGPNTVVHQREMAWWFYLLRAFNNAFILLLLALAVVAALTEDFEAAIIISVMVLISGVLRFTQEYRSGKAAEALKKMVQTTASVVRQGVKTEIAVSELVPGDIVHLSAGDMVPADIRLTASKDLFISQSALSGESLPVEKFAEGQCPQSADALEHPKLCLMGTSVVSGSGTGVVVQTGARTVFGVLAQQATESEVETEFDRGVSHISRLLIRFTLIMTPIVFLINGLTKGDWTQAFFFALAVAVGLTPEMLPMIVTANLARGAVNMSGKKVIVKRLDSIQNFGAMDVLCSDKTGTLTQDRVILKRHLDVQGRESEKVLQLAYLNSYYQTGLKNLLDVAVLKDAELERGLHVATSYRLVDEIPFDFERRRMSVIVETEKHQELLIAKGAVEEVLAVSTSLEIDHEERLIEEADRERVRELARRLNDDGFRVLGVAFRHFPLGKKTYSVEDEDELVLAGFIAFLDPPKESAAPALRALREHNITVKILTGDNEVVTRRVCVDVGLDPGRIVLGREIEAMDDDALAAAASEATVFAKISPIQKSRIIRALQTHGHVVGFLGDGINDAPALRQADIGISVNSAVDIAKESAGLILLEKSLMVLEQGVIEGRKTFGNILKYIRMGTSSNFGNVFSVLGASAWLPFLPMQPIQLLVQNMLYDFSQIAIPFDHVDPDYLKMPRRWQVNAVARFMLVFGPVSSIFDYVTFAVMWFFFAAKTPASQSLFQSGWFVEGLLSQTLIVHIIRTRKIPFIESSASAPLIFMAIFVMLIGLLLPYTPLGANFGLTPLPLAYYGWLLLILLGYVVLAQLVKNWFARKYGF